MITVLSILVSSSLAGFLLSLLKFIKIQRAKKINLAEPIKNKKWRIAVIYLMIIFGSFIILGISVFFAGNFN